MGDTARCPIKEAVLREFMAAQCDRLLMFLGQGTISTTPFQLQSRGVATKRTPTLCNSASFPGLFCGEPARISLMNRSAAIWADNLCDVGCFR